VGLPRPHPRKAHRESRTPGEGCALPRGSGLSRPAVDLSPRWFRRPAASPGSARGSRVAAASKSAPGNIPWARLSQSARRSFRYPIMAGPLLAARAASAWMRRASTPEARGSGASKASQSRTPGFHGSRSVTPSVSGPVYWAVRIRLAHRAPTRYPRPRRDSPISRLQRSGCQHTDANGPKRGNRRRSFAGAQVPNASVIASQILRSRIPRVVQWI
jgi:hypothetical protein